MTPTTTMGGASVLPTDRPLTAGDVPLLREGDLVAPMSDLTDYRGGKLPAGVPVPVLNVSSDGYIRVADPKWGHRSHAFTFVSRPATSAASEVVGDEPWGWNREVCTGCSASLTLEEIKSRGCVSCCPDRRMVKVRDLVDAYEAALASPPVSERERELERALRVAATAIGCLTFDDEIRPIIGNTNFEILKANAAEIRRLTAQPAGEGE